MNKISKLIIVLLSVCVFFQINSMASYAEEADMNYNMMNEVNFKAGENFPVGLINFKGYGSVYVNDMEFYLYDQINIRINKGDQVDIYSYYDDEISYQVSAKPNLKQIQSGYYLIGTDIAEGSYNIKVSNWDDYADLEVLNSKGERITSYNVYDDEKLTNIKLKKGEYLYVVMDEGSLIFEQVKVTALKLTKTSLAIMPGQSYKVTATASPNFAPDQTIVWSSSNTKIATVDQAGNIKGIAAGKAVITATAKSNATIKKTVAVTVEKKKIALNTVNKKLDINGNITLKATVSPTDATNKNVTWKSSNTKIATVSSTGVVTAKSKGTVKISASSASATTVYATITVNPPVAAKSIKLNKTAVSLVAGNKFAIKPTISPANTTNKAVTYKSSNVKIAKVDAKGNVTAVAKGTATITVKTANGKAATLKVTVTPKPITRNFGPGVYTGGKDIPVGRYEIVATKGDYGNVYVQNKSYNYNIYETLSGPDDDLFKDVTKVTTFIENGAKITVSNLTNVRFTQVSHVKKTVLHSGHWIVGKDIAAGKYTITSTSSSGNFFMYRPGKYYDDLIYNKLLAAKPTSGYVTSFTATLVNGDRIEISGMDAVKFTKR